MICFSTSLLQPKHLAIDLSITRRSNRGLANLQLVASHSLANLGSWSRLHTDSTSSSLSPAFSQSELPRDSAGVFDSVVHLHCVLPDYLVQERSHTAESLSQRYANPLYVLHCRLHQECLTRCQELARNDKSIIALGMMARGGPKVISNEG